MKGLDKEIEEIADYLGCNKGELVSEVGKLVAQAVQEALAKDRADYQQSLLEKIGGKREESEKLANEHSSDQIHTEYWNHLQSKADVWIEVEELIKGEK